MSWTHILQDDPGERVPLRERIARLLQQQRDTWPALGDGEAALATLQRKTLKSSNESIVVQFNPARRRSTQAKMDAVAIAARPCFLCPQNMPAEERGVAFEDLVILPNPFPVLPSHMTVASREHRPQQIGGEIWKMLRLARELGPDLAVLYNGPRCGASAPDHFHFQTASALGIPLLAELSTSVRGISAHMSFGRNFFVCSSPIAREAENGVEEVMAALSKRRAEDGEPMVNILAVFRDEQYIALVFPRVAHRPSMYFNNGPERIAVSPAVLEMCGVLVTTEAEDFARIDAATARRIYEEVSISTSEFKSCRWR